MSRNVWIGLICVAVAYVLYTAWQRSQLAARVPVTGNGAAASGGGGGWADSLGRIAEQLVQRFTSKGTTAAAAPAAPTGSSGVAWV